MGESSACLVRSFSAGTSAEPKEGDPHRALTTSISFGRFTSEPLAWEKWSCFSNNRYLEEAEKSSKPGSVAEKKAYFEAHYKRIAAKKAAELLDQQNVASNEFVLLESDNVDHTHYSSLVVSEPSKSDSPKTDLVLSVDANVRKPNVEENNSETDEVEEAEIATEQLVIEENSIQVESSIWNENVEIRSKIMSSQQEKLATTGSSHQRNLSSSSKKKQLIPSSNPFTYIRASKLHSFLKLSPVQPRKEDSATQPSQKGASNVVEKPRSTLNSLHVSINISSHACETRKTSPTIHKMGNSKTVRNVAKTSRDSSTTRQTPTRASVNDLSARPSEIHLPERLRSKTLGVCSGSGRWPAVGKSQSPYVNHLNPADASGHKARPPMLASTFSFRCEERAAKRKEKLEEKLNAEAEKARLQVKSKPIGCQSLPDLKNQLQQLPEYLTGSNMFPLNTEQDKADNFLKMRQSTGVMGKPIPNSNHGTESPITHVEKIPLTRPRSPKLGGKPTHSVVKDTVSLPPWRSLADIVGSKHFISKSNRTPFHPTN